MENEKGKERKRKESLTFTIGQGNADRWGFLEKKFA
jgi:hypothetical protein